MKILAPAKINLYLEIVGVRKDGNHELRTVFQTVGLYDEIDLRWQKRGAGQPPLSLSLQARDGTDGLCPGGADNIVWKAADRIYRQVPWEGSACLIALRKRIPVQAGLGGGSSDAAAALLAIQKTWLAKRPEKKGLERTAAELGADVPFFLEGGCAYATGKGDKIRPLRPAPRFWCVIVKPKLGLSTREVYGWYDRARGKRPRLTPRSKVHKIIELIRARKPLRDWAPYLYNSFEGVVFKKVPEIRRIKEALIRLGAENALLSGSGSSLFALAGSREQGEKIKRRFRHPGAMAWVVRSV